jgi:hypothetical protein
MRRLLLPSADGCSCKDCGILSLGIALVPRKVSIDPVDFTEVLRYSSQMWSSAWVLFASMSEEIKVVVEVYMSCHISLSPDATQYRVFHYISRAKIQK